MKPVDMTGQFGEPSVGINVRTVQTDCPNLFSNAEDAIRYMEATNYTKDIEIYDIDPEPALQMVNDLYKAIQWHNMSIVLPDQILPTRPYASIGILPDKQMVYIYTVKLSTYEENLHCVAWTQIHNKDVLDSACDRIGPIDLGNTYMGKVLISLSNKKGDE